MPEPNDPSGDRGDSAGTKPAEGDDANPPTGSTPAPSLTQLCPPAQLWTAEKSRALAEEGVKTLNLRVLGLLPHPEDERELERAESARPRPRTEAPPASTPTAHSHPAKAPDLALAAWLATRLHATQKRKGTNIPYISHLFCVSALVLEYGGDEEQAIAALLHDAVEDQGGEAAQTIIRLAFGERVESIVLACTDTDQNPKPPWGERKKAYLAHLRYAPLDALLVSAADKLHNARSILNDLRLEGLSVYDRFSAPNGADDTLWYYRELAMIFMDRAVGSIATELDRVVTQLEDETEQRRRA